MNRDAWAPLEARIGHLFADAARLETALTHKSYLNENSSPARADNERYEFLGDAVVGLTVSHLLMEAFPERSEGELSKNRASIVNEQSLADVARALGLGEWLFLGRGEEQSGGRHKSSLLADACEALVAAVYLDGGFDAAMRVARRLFGDRVRAASEPGRADFKTRLQELAQATLRLQPRYQVMATVGPDHDKTFEVGVVLGERAISRAEGKSKKEAEQRAAEQALLILDAEAAPPPAPAPTPNDPLPTK